MSGSDSSTIVLGDRTSPSKAALDMMQEWLRGLKENVLDALDPLGPWFNPVREFVEEEITGTWTRYLAEISWFRAQTARALRPSRLSLRPSQVYKEAAEELYDKVFLKLGTLPGSSTEELAIRFGQPCPPTPRPRGSAPPEETQSPDQQEWPDLNHGCWSMTPSPRSIDSNPSGS